MTVTTTGLAWILSQDLLALAPLHGMGPAAVNVPPGTMAILAYVSGNIIFSDYLNIMYIPNSGELVIFAGAGP